MKQRNPDATCRTCPYWGYHDIPHTRQRKCCGTPSVITKHPDAYCSLHPNFFVDTVEQLRQEAESRLADLEWGKMREEVIRKELIRKEQPRQEMTKQEDEEAMRTLAPPSDKAAEKPVCAFCKKSISDEDLAWRLTRRHGDAGWFCNENCARSWGALHEDTRTI